MGIKVEFNPDLALRRARTPNRSLEECLPEYIEKGEVYGFLKKGQRNYWLEGEIPLLETDGQQHLSRPLASIKIITATHFINDNEVYTKGLYRIIEIFNLKDSEVYFEGMNRRK